MTLLPLGKPRAVATCPLSALVDVGYLSDFVAEERGTTGEWSKIIQKRILRETLRQNRLDYNNVAIDNWNSN